MNKYLIYIFFTVFFLNSCSIVNNIDKKILTIKNSYFFTKESKFILSNFNIAVEKIILELLKYQNIFTCNNTLLFINILDNHTKITVDKNQLTDVIKKNIFKKVNNISFIDTKTIENSKKQLGILNTNSSIDTSTAILLARNNHAKYYLCSFISEKKSFFLTIQLILVKTGEIIFTKTEKFY